MISSAIELHAVSKRYQEGKEERVALNHVELKIERSSFWLVHGPSGSGKTSLLRTMAGLITPSEGEVFLCGKSMVHMREHHRTAWRRTSCGIVMQNVGLIPNMTLLDNVLVPVFPNGLPAHSDLARAQNLLERLGLASRAKSKVETLSGGERQRGAIARALLLDPPVLLFDEPTAHLDTKNAQLTMDILTSLHKEGRTVILATHDPRLHPPDLSGTIELEDGRVLSIRSGNKKADA